jgi:hypothetical protein
VQAAQAAGEVEMMLRFSSSLLAAMLLASAGVAQPLIFDDLPRNQQVGEGYGALGVHFALSDFGVVGGLGEGDPGNWSLEGTNGTAFMGFNGSPSYDMDIHFDARVVDFSMDASRSNGSGDGDGLSVQFWMGDETVFKTEIAFKEINTWTTISYAGPLDRVTFQGSGGGFHPYGVDNIVFGAASGCYPDFTEDGVLDLFDFLAYVNAFNEEDPGADCDESGVLDLFDFLCFVNAFDKGC